MPNQAPKRYGFGPFLMIAGGVILIFAVILMLLLSNTPTQAVIQPTVVAAVPTIDVPRVTLVNALQAYNQKTAVFVDVRDTDSYAQAHIPGAINIPLENLPARSVELDPNKWIITYCT